jgi:Ca-activated chloride channel family protein
MRSRRAASFVCVFVLAALAVLRAVDARHGDIAGVVSDGSGAALPGVTVTVSGPERRTATTDARGEFSFVNLLPGSYDVRAALPGFTTAIAKVSIAAAQSGRLDLRMSVDVIAETVTVTGDTPAAAPASVSQRAGGVPGGVVGGVVGNLASGGRAEAAGQPIAPGGRMASAYATDFPIRGGRPESYEHVDENGFHRVGADPLSTFSIDVDTASYANIRRFLSDGSLPPPAAVRVEEMINYFRYDYPRPSGATPFSITTEVTGAPWNPQHRLALVGIQGQELQKADVPRNLVFLLDVSGSMNSPDKLPLVRNAMRMLVDTLTDRDRVAIVVYAGASGVALPSTPGNRKAEIHQAIAALDAGGSTNGAAGIRLAYKIARDHFVRGGVNRVLLATDGDFNVGVTSQEELVELIERERASGVFLSVLGVGTGNLQDAVMEKLADRGNGNYSYLDSLHEARKVLVREAGGTLVTIAKDVKIQVEFNPRLVSAYRLIGYENRLLQHEDFNDDLKDAGEIGAGHSVTALYEIVPVGVALQPAVDPLKYQQDPQPARVPSPAASRDELMTVKVRYKAPAGAESRLVSAVVPNQPRPPTANIGFASAVAEVGMLLRGSKHLGSASYDAAIARARAFSANDPDGYRAEFVRLAELADGLRRLDVSTR